jgi:rRNA-processing protein FCF1
MTDTILSQSIFFYPIRKLTATYHYRKVGVPTVFDELVMTLANDFPKLADYSLGQISTLMQLDQIFLQHTLSSLVDLNVLEQISLDSSIEDVKLSELKLTELGKDFFHRKQMPGRRRSKSENFIFNPLNQKYIKLSGTNTASGDLNLNESLFPVADEMLTTLSLQETKNLTWFSSDVEIEPNGISHELDQSEWQSVKVKLSLDKNRNLHLTSEDKIFKQWLADRSSELIREHLLDPILVRAKKEMVLTEVIRFIQYKEDELRSMVLVDQKSDLSMLKNAVPVKFSDKQVVSDTSPFVVFDPLIEKAELNGMHLSVPFDRSLPECTSQLFFQFQSRRVFEESKGFLATSFDYHSQNLPVKIVTESDTGWIQDIPAFKKPNVDCLVFMANFISETELVAKLPIMNIADADAFHQRIKQTWGKNFAPENWIEKICLLMNEDEFALFTKLFSRVPVRLSQIVEIFQGRLLDMALDNHDSIGSKVQEFKSILSSVQPLKELNTEKMQLKMVNAEVLKAIRKWQACYADFRHNFSLVANSSGSLIEKDEHITSWSRQVADLFEPVQVEQSFAVLDTNFLMNQTKKLAEIQSNRTVILPKTVIYELDKLKQANKKELDEAQHREEQARFITEAQIQKKNDLIRDVKEASAKLEDRNGLSEAECRSLTARKIDLDKQKQASEKDLKKAESEQTKVNHEVRKLKENGYKIREASRKIEELKLAEHLKEENREILNLVVGGELPVADDKILAVAAQYKLNDVLLFTEDKGLRSKAISIGIKTA